MRATVKDVEFSATRARILLLTVLAGILEADSFSERSHIASAGHRDLGVAAAHEIRIECAARHLPQSPMRDYGIDRLIAEARENVGVTMGHDVLAWLPAAEGNFHGL